MADHTWECACGGFVAKLRGPPVFTFTCHCRSCVAPARHLDRERPEGTSALVLVRVEAPHRSVGVDDKPPGNRAVNNRDRYDLRDLAMWTYFSG